MSLTLLSDKYSNYQPCRECGFYVTPADEACPMCYTALPHQTTYEGYVVEYTSKQRWVDFNKGLLTLFFIILLAISATFIFETILAGVAAAVVSYLARSNDIDALLHRKSVRLEDIDIKRIPEPVPQNGYSFEQSESIQAIEHRISDVLATTKHEIALGKAAHHNAKEISIHRSDAKDQSERIAEIIAEIELEALQLSAYKLNIDVLKWKNEIEYIIYRKADVSDIQFETQRGASPAEKLSKSEWARVQLMSSIANLEQLKTKGEDVLNEFTHIKQQIIARNSEMPVLDVYIQNQSAYLKNVQDYMLDLREMLLKYQLTEMNNLRGDNTTEIMIKPQVEQNWKLDMVAEVKSLNDSVFETERQLALLAIKLADSPGK